MSFSDRFDESWLADGDVVEVRASRGPRLAGSHRLHVVPERLFARLVSLGRAYELPVIANVEIYGTTPLNAQQARRFNDEVAFLAAIVSDAALAPHFDALVDVASYCWQTSETSVLTIEGP